MWLSESGGFTRSAT